MMISQGEFRNVLRGHLRRTRAGAEGEGPERLHLQRMPAARRECPTETNDILKLRTLLRELPELRADRVKALSERISAGRYEIEADQVASQILARALSDSLCSVRRHPSA